MDYFLIRLVGVSFLLVLLNGCIIAAAGAGAEAGYVLAQEDRTAIETVDDQRLTTTIKSKFLASPAVSGFNINVDTFKSVVTLEGEVGTEREKNTAISLARETYGVKKVISKLVVVK